MVKSVSSHGRLDTEMVAGLAAAYAVFRQVLARIHQLFPCCRPASTALVAHHHGTVLLRGGVVRLIRLVGYGGNGGRIVDVDFAHLVLGVEMRLGASIAALVGFGRLRIPLRVVILIRLLMGLWLLG